MKNIHLSGIVILVAILLLGACTRGSNFCVQIWEQGQVADAVYLPPQKGSDPKSILRVPELYEANGELYVKGIRTQIKQDTAYSYCGGKVRYTIIPDNGEEVVYHKVQYECGSSGYLEKKGDEGWVTQLPPEAKQIHNVGAWESSMYWINTPDHGLTITYDEPALHSTAHALYATPLAITTGVAVDVPITIIVGTSEIVINTLKEVFLLFE